MEKYEISRYTHLSDKNTLKFHLKTKGDCPSRQKLSEMSFRICRRDNLAHPIHREYILFVPWLHDIDVGPGPLQI